MIDIDTSDKKEQRKFGLVMAGAIIVLGLIRFGLHWHREEAMPTLPYYYFALAFLLGVLGLTIPGALKPFFDIWIKLASVLNYIVTHLVLTIAFFFTILPIGIIMRVIGHDPLDRKLDKDATTYWQDVETHTDESGGYTKQY